MIKEIVFYIVILLLMSSGSVFLALSTNRNYEEILPLALTGMVMLLFGAGTVGMLETGLIVLCFAAALLYVLSGRIVLKKGRAVLKRIFTPAAFLFALSLLVLFFINYGRQVYRIDEMTHWADTVKAMYYSGVLPDSPELKTMFPSYPPAMALMEWLFLKIHGLLEGNEAFAEWVMYVAYQSFMLAFFFPFLKKLELKKPLLSVVCFGMVMLCPLMMDASHPYSSLYIDPFMSMVFGCGLAMVFTEKCREKYYDAYIACCCIMLVLVKPSGLMIAAFLAAVYVAELFVRSRNGRERIRGLVLASGSVIIPTLVWALHKAVVGVTQSFSSKGMEFDFSLLIRLILHRDGESWQQFAHDEFYLRLFTDTVRIKGFQCPYWLLFAVSLMGMFILVWLMSKGAPELRPASKVIIPAVFLIGAIYYVSLCYMYIFMFGWWEAIILASFERYIGVVLYAVYTAALLSFVVFLMEGGKKWQKLCLALAVFLLFTPFGRTMEIAKRSDLKQSGNYYTEFKSLSEKITKLSEGEAANVYLVEQGSRGGEFYGFCYTLRPHATVDKGQWFFGKAPGFGELEDRFVSPEDWQTELKNNYDYVFIYKLDDFFVEEYAQLFTVGSEPEENAIYSVSDEGLLIFEMRI